MTEKAPENVEASKLEWGQELGPLSYNEANKKIEELNTKLAEGEKTWRLPSKEELLAEFRKTNSTPVGFQNGFYWSGDIHQIYAKAAYAVSMRNSDVTWVAMDGTNHVRCVR